MGHLQTYFWLLIAFLIGVTFTLRHPLDPLSEDEIRKVVAIIQTAHPNPHWAYNYIALKDPQKSVLLPYFLEDKLPPEGTIPRHSFVVLIDRKTRKVYEVLVNLDKGAVESFQEAPPNSDPSFSPDEMLMSERVAMEDSGVIERCKNLGFPNMTLVNGDLWSVGYIGDRPEYQGKRLVMYFFYGKYFDEDNAYAHPFDFIAVVDLNEEKVINIEDLPTSFQENLENSSKSKVVPPLSSANFNPLLKDPSYFRNDFKPVKISQPNGASWSIAGNLVSWQKFKFRVQFSGREGLIIHHVTYQDGGKVRPLFYRMSLAEMFIPYADPRAPYHRKGVFDEGQYGIGFNADELQSEVDCLGQVYFFDGVFHNEKGEPKRFPKRLCLYEEDAGILWKHTDFRTGKAATVRNQRLVMTFILTVTNYDYIISWWFYLDGTIEFNVKLTGMLSTNLLAEGETPGGYGSLVYPQLNAQYHQHFFGLRIDPEVDGNKNTVVITDVVPLEGETNSKENPYGQGFTTKKKVLKKQGEGRSLVCPENSRSWHVRNEGKMNEYSKEPVAWKLVIPWPTPPLKMRRDSPLHGQAGWLDSNVWVTRFKENQNFPGGFYLGNGTGLPEWVGRDEEGNIKNEDVVLWVNLGVTHIPRTEDFPVMPMESTGMMLKPVNFFLENPALDVPGPKIK